jgi:D-alanyl-lipoteichoic acid acyltransferase DltB (MBOAT superfamily)
VLFNSYSFLFIFAPLAIAAYHISRYYLGINPAILSLCIASYIFYLFGEHAYPYLLAASILFNYAVGITINRSAIASTRRIWLVVGLCGNLLALGFFKYTNFIVAQLDLAGAPVPDIGNIVLPIGISFYTFTQIAFIVDVYRRKSSEHRFAPYFLFVTFFPHLIAGPILHHKEMIPQFLRHRTPRFSSALVVGLALFTLGLAKKTLIADSVAPTSSAIFSAASQGISVGFVEAWVGVFAYSAQIYFDFSGYSDMALGLAKMLGVRLPINFNSPYKATSIVDFWRRWHITLSRFLRDYLYFSLGGNRLGVTRRYANLFVTMLLGGLWHGANWTFIVWGAGHGLLLGLAHLWSDLSAAKKLPQLPLALAWFLTFMAVVILWVPFRADSMASALTVWRGMAGMNGLGLPEYGVLSWLAKALGAKVIPVAFTSVDIITIAGALLLAVLAPNSQQILRRYHPGLDSPGYDALAPSGYRGIRLTAWSVCGFGLIFGIAVRMISSNSEFIYFQF